MLQVCTIFVKHIFSNFNQCQRSYMVHFFIGIYIMSLPNHPCIAFVHIVNIFPSNLSVDPFPRMQGWKSEAQSRDLRDPRKCDVMVVTGTKNNMGLKNHPIEKDIIFQTSMFGFHVNFPSIRNLPKLIMILKFKIDTTHIARICIIYHIVEIITLFISKQRDTLGNHPFHLHVRDLQPLPWSTEA